MHFNSISHSIQFSSLKSIELNLFDSNECMHSNEGCFKSTLTGGVGVRWRRVFDFERLRFLPLAFFSFLLFFFSLLEDESLLLLLLLLVDPFVSTALVGVAFSSSSSSSDESSSLSEDEL